VARPFADVTIKGRDHLLGAVAASAICPQQIGNRFLPQHAGRLNGVNGAPVEVRVSDQVELRNVKYTRHHRRLHYRSIRSYHETVATITHGRGSCCRRRSLFLVTMPRPEDMENLYDVGPALKDGHRPQT